MLLANVVETSRRITDTSKRLEKIDLLATLLRQLDPEEIEIVVAFLSGFTRQGRIGIGGAALRAAAAPPAGASTLQLHEADRELELLAKAQGAGSARQKRELLYSLLSRATHDART
jgi:DNA ligase-1